MGTGFFFHNGSGKIRLAAWFDLILYFVRPGGMRWRRPHHFFAADFPSSRSGPPSAPAESECSFPLRTSTAAENYYRESLRSEAALRMVREWRKGQGKMGLRTLKFNFEH